VKDVKQHQENGQKREERYKRQLEIAEAAANEDRDMRATQIRESLMMNRFFSLFLEKRLKKIMEKFSQTEEAFQKVRKIAGINDASEMVTKFLTAELSFNDVRRTIANTTGHIDETQEKIYEIEQKISNTERFKIQSGTIEILKKDVLSKLKLISSDKQKLMKIKGIHEKIKSWALRNLKKFGIKNNKDSLSQDLNLIKQSVLKALVSLLKAKNSDHSLKSLDKVTNLTLKNIINGINPESFTKRNKEQLEDLDEIRVMKDLAQLTDISDQRQKKK
jgi:hypothetical protein